MPIIIPKGRDRYPELATFIGGWFHQDFDIHGDSLEEVVAAFMNESDANLIQPLVNDIDAFLATGDEDMEKRFQDLFNPDIIPTAFRSTTHEFLAAIRKELVAERRGPLRQSPPQC